MRPFSIGSSWIAASMLSFGCLVPGMVHAQATRQSEGAPGGYAGINIRVPGIYLTPVANAPFSATEHVVTHQKTADGSDRVLQTTTHIARASSGLTYTEIRRLMPAASTQKPGLMEGQIYDPATHRSTLYDPATHIARLTTLSRPRPLVPGPTAALATPRPGVVETELGTQMLEGLELRGLRRVRTIPAEASGTGSEVQVTDEYWYSPALSIYMIIRHDDPRTGEQLIALSEVNRSEPESTRFRVPDEYKLVDETPLPAPAGPARP